MTRLALGAVAGLLTLTLASAHAAPARDSTVSIGETAVVKDVLACRALTDSAQRLACFDGAAARMSEAEASGQVVVVDRAQAREVRRQAFGFNLPSLNLFKGAKEPELDEVQVSLKSATQGLRGKWRFVTQDGAIWDEIEDEPLARQPRAGSSAVIRKGAFGSYNIKVDGQPSVKVRRVQ